MPSRWLVCFETRSGRRVPIELWGAERIWFGASADDLIANARSMGITGNLVAVRCDENARAMGRASIAVPFLIGELSDRLERDYEREPGLSRRNLPAPRSRPQLHELVGMAYFTCCNESRCVCTCPTCGVQEYGGKVCEGCQ